MTEGFQWIRPGYKLVKAKLEWNVDDYQSIFELGSEEIRRNSPTFFSQESPNSRWQLRLHGEGRDISINVMHINSEGVLSFVDPFLLKFALLNGKGQKVLQQMISTQPNENRIPLSKLETYSYPHSNGSLTVYFKIFFHLKSKYILRNNPLVFCTDQLVTQLEELFDKMPFSDVNFIIQDREFPAHKNILVTRSKVFASMFEHPTKEQFTNEIEIEDIEPEVFRELLHFIYTGRVSSDNMDTLAAGLLIAADKYLLDGLTMICEDYLSRYISPDNCVELLLHGDLENPSVHLKEAAKYFLRYPSRVMATDKWETAKEENPALLCDIQEFVFSCKNNFCIES